MVANGIKVLVDLLTLAHLHTSRAVVPTQVCILYINGLMIVKWDHGIFRLSQCEFYIKIRQENFQLKSLNQCFLDGKILQLLFISTCFEVFCGNFTCFLTFLSIQDFLMKICSYSCKLLVHICTVLQNQKTDIVEIDMILRSHSPNLDL